MRGVVAACLTVVFCMFLPALSASGEDIMAVFTPDRQKELCGTSTVVDRGRLLAALIDEAQVPSGLIDLVGRTPADKESAEIRLYLNRRHAFVEDRPFTSTGSDLFGKRATDSEARLRKLRGGFGEFVGTAEVVPRGGYRLVRAGGSAPGTFIDPNRFFDLKTTDVRIECVAAAPRPSEPGKPEPSNTVAPALPEWVKGFRIRGKLEELGVSRTAADFTSIKTADISLKRDEKIDGNGDTFQINAVVGLQLDQSTSDMALHYILYGWYQRTDVPTGSKQSNVHAFSPGLQLNKLWKHSETAWTTISVSPQATLDFRQHSEVLKIKGAIEPPAFPLFPLPPAADDRPRYQMVGGYGPLIGPFSLRPQVQGIFELAQIIDRGSNKALKDARTYFGFGADLGLKIRLPFVPVLENLVGSIEYRHLQLFGANIDNAHRLSASLNYNFSKDNPYMTVKLGYEDGRNVETFQDERFWTFSLGVRY